MASSRKVIITCAVTGSTRTPAMSPDVPITPEQIAENAIGELAQNNADQMKKIRGILASSLA